MAYFKFHCACNNCQEMVQVEGQFHRGHRPAEQAANEARAVAAQARAVERAREEAKRQQVIDNLVKGLTASNPENHVSRETSTPAADDQPGDPPPVFAPDPAPEKPTGQGQAGPALQGFDSTESVQPVSGPPQYGPVDGRRWRLAEDKLNTPKTNPWIETRCSNCSSQMWTRDPANTYQNAGLCQECVYYLMNELGDYGQRQFRTQTRTFRDVFRPR